MPSVETMLRNWRESLNCGGALSVDDVAELEVHVRDAIDDLTSRGLSHEEAMLVALRRVGDPSVLTVEFKKVNPGLAWGRRFYWMALGSLGLSVLWQGARVLMHLAAVATAAMGGTVTVAASLAFATAASCMATLITIMSWSSSRPAGQVATLMQKGERWIASHPVLASAGLVGIGFIMSGLPSTIYWRMDSPLPLLGWVRLAELIAVMLAPVALFVTSRRLAFSNGQEMGTE